MLTKIRLAQLFNELMRTTSDTKIDWNELFKAIVVRKNKEYINKFTKTLFKERIVLLPQCLRNTEKCKAKETDFGYQCADCGSCQITEIIKESAKLNYQKVYIIKCVRALSSIISKNRPGAVLGVGCDSESALGIITCEQNKIPVQYIVLATNDCANNKTDFNKVKDLLNFKEEDV